MAGAAEVRGVTLFTGVQSRVTIRPGAPCTGIVFSRCDVGGVGGHEPIPAPQRAQDLLAHLGEEGVGQG